MKNILGLKIDKGRVVDRFFLMTTGLILGSLDEFFSGKNIEEIESPLWNRIRMVEAERDAMYRKALSLLIETDLLYKDYLPKQLRKNWNHKKSQWRPGSKKRKLIRLSIWIIMGYSIPTIDLDENLVKDLLKEKDFAFVRKSGKMGWWFSDLLLGKNYLWALAHLESFEPVDRARLVKGLIIHA